MTPIVGHTRAGAISRPVEGILRSAIGSLRCLLAVLLLLPAFVACREAPPGKSAEAPPQAQKISRAYEDGPLHVRLHVNKDRLTVAESLQLTLEADAPEGYEVQFPPMGQKLDELRITDYRTDGPELTAEGLVRTRKRYTLEPFLSGPYTIAPMEIVFLPPAKDSEKSSDRESRRIRTEELTIQVRSLLGEERGELQLHPIFGPVELPRSLVPWMAAGAGLALLAGLGAAGFWWTRRRRGGKDHAVPPPLPPQELAYRQLQEILDDGLLDQGAFKDLFSRISDVIRLYMENRFGLHAPKLTTEEFLATLHGRSPFTPEQQHLLDEFLKRCDLVKFAADSVTREEAERHIEACRAFIDATRSEPGGNGAD